MNKIEVRLFQDRLGKKECTFIEYKRIFLNLRDTRKFKRDIRSVNMRNDARYGERKYFYTNKTEFGYKVKTHTPEQHISMLGLYVNNERICLDAVKGDTDVNSTYSNLVFLKEEFVIELMQEHEDLI